jgi:hypothetical protein
LRGDVGSKVLKMKITSFQIAFTQNIPLTPSKGDFFKEMMYGG